MTYERQERQEVRGEREDAAVRQLDGLVVGVDGPVFWVDAEGREYPCTMRGRLRKDRQEAASLLVIGDAVAIRVLPDGSGVVERRAPRRTELSRPVSFRGVPHVIAANLDLLVVVQSARLPNFRRTLTERFLAMAHHARMDALVVVNKCDLEDGAIVRQWVRPLVDNGVPVLLTSAAIGTGLEELRCALTGKASVLAGQSGVGKSTLVNALYPQFGARVGAVSTRHQKGRHSTTSGRLYRLPGGGYLADTPGLRELALFDDMETETAEIFPEIQAAAQGCKFRDCSHTHEPHCAVKAAVERGEIDRGRYESYVRMQGGK